MNVEGESEEGEEEKKGLELEQTNEVAFTVSILSTPTEEGDEKIYVVQLSKIKGPQVKFLTVFKDIAEKFVEE